jgi:antitoxin component YwqK of YwqJK toxin-antitoxin module
VNRVIKILPAIVTLLMFTGCSNDENYEVVHHENGEIKYKVPIVNGKREGILMKYKENGELELKSKWENGIKEGFAIQYFDNGNVMVSENFLNGQLHGKVERFDTLGNIIEKYFYLNGKKNGDYFSFYDNGQIEVKGHYLEDYKDGNAVIYYKTGKIKEKLIYHQDQLVYRTSFSENGSERITQLALDIRKMDNEESNDEVITLKFELLYSYSQTGKISLALGNFNDQGELESDEVFESKSLSVIIPMSKAQIEKANGIVEGKVIELEQTNDTLSTYRFRYNLYKNQYESL